jgi:hypothetical protein
VQSGDQTTPDVPGQAAATETSTDAPEAGSTPESPSAPADGPGGHQDIGASADHQFDGSE